MSPENSILITTFNTMMTVRPSLESVLSQIDENFEVIVVDSYSNDGTLEYLEDLADEGRVRLIVQRCNRGRGRQIALENAKGKYVVARVDMDTTHNPVFNEIIRLYKNNEKEIGDFLLNAGVMVSARDFLLKIGGWLPLHWGENYELYKRLMDVGKLYLCRFEESSVHMKFRRKFSDRMRVAYVNYRDSMRMGLGFMVVAKELWENCSFAGFLIRFLTLCLSWVTHHFYTRYSTFRDTTWEEFFRDKIYADELNLFEVNHPDKVIAPPESLRRYPKMVTRFLE